MIEVRERTKTGAEDKEFKRSCTFKFTVKYLQVTVDFVNCYGEIEKYFPNYYIYIPTYKEGEKTVYIHAAEKEEI